jgi:glycosyltransferase involved in cell wall biosynthesis
MRLLLSADTVGGVWTYALDLAAALRPQATDVVIATLGRAASAAQRADAAAAGATLIDTGLPLDWTAETPAEVTAAGKALARLALRARADIVQLHSPALLAEARFAMPVVVVAHSCVATWWAAVRTGPLPDELAWRAAQTRAGLLRADAAVAPTAAFADALMQAYDLPASPLPVHNGREASAFPLRAAPPFAFSAGRLWDEGKDAATLDRVASCLPVPLRVAGPTYGPNGARIQLAHAEALGGLDPAAVRQLLAARPVFMSTARYEPFGLAVLEAAQAGCALVLSDIPTFRELWDGAAAFAPPGDDVAFAAAASALLADAQARERAGAAARARAAEYSLERCAAAMHALHSQLLAGRQGRAAA